MTSSITPGMSLSLQGELKASRGKGQAVELVVKECEVLGACDPEVSSQPGVDLIQLMGRRIPSRRNICRSISCENKRTCGLRRPSRPLRCGSGTRSCGTGTTGSRWVTSILQRRQSTYLLNLSVMISSNDRSRAGERVHAHPYPDPHLVRLRRRRRSLPAPKPHIPRL